MKILITGANGFVGRHIYEHYLNTDVEIDAIDPAWSSTSTVERFVAGTSYVGDRLKHYDIVYHCAAFVGGRAGIDNSAAYLHTYNTALDALMFEWALRNKPGRFVYFSSSAAYPERYQSKEWKQAFLGYEPLVEDDIAFDSLDAPEASYGLSKLHGEQMAVSVRAEVPVTVLRPFSGYGEDQSLDYPFPSFIDRARRRESPFTVWGDGTQTRDWIHIRDFVEAAVLCAEGGVDGPVNLCTGIGTTFDELAALCMKTAGYHADIEHLDKGRGNGVDYRVGDPTALHQIYVPRITIAEGVERALAQ